jgi:broad specificity phosphatase PhoE
LTTRLILIRHGQTEWNRYERFRGRADIGLDSTGMEQARAIAQRASSWHPAAIYSSPLRRALETAQPLATRLSMAVEQIPDLTDVDYGLWQGLTVDEARRAFPEAFSQWRDSPRDVCFPQGESMQGVRQRASGAIDRLVSRHPEQSFVVVSHVVVCRLLILHLLGLDSSHFWRIRQDNGAINLFEFRDGISVAMSINDTCHLKPRGDGAP